MPDEPTVTQIAQSVALYLCREYGGDVTPTKDPFAEQPDMIIMKLTDGRVIRLLIEELSR